MPRVPDISPRRNTVTIRPFQPSDADCFRKLNEEWITRYFRIEPEDEKLLSDPEGHILAEGGMILIAMWDGTCVGCCALLRIGDGEYEVAKMAVTAGFQGAGIGRSLLMATIQAARDAGAHRLCLESNRTLTTALRLYQSVGFQQIRAEQVAPSSYARVDVSMEMMLD